MSIPVSDGSAPTVVGIHPTTSSAGFFAGEFGVPRVLRLLERRGITSTWFWPGHSIEIFPASARICVDAGYEIGAHGYSHQNPRSLTFAQEHDVMSKSVELIDRLCGRRPAAMSRRGGS